MPAEIVTMADCASNYGVFRIVGSKGDVYTVSFGGSEGPAHCTCPAWKYAPDDNKHCKHVDKVYKGACMYNPQWHDGNRDPDFRPSGYTYSTIIPGEQCPACGGPMVAVRRAV